MRFLGLLLALAVPISVLAGDSQPKETSPVQIPWDEIKKACQEYLDAFASKDPKNDTSVASMKKKLEDRVNQKMRDDSTASRDSAMRNIMFDWAADNKSNLENEEPKAVIQACFYFVTFLDAGYDMPHQVTDRIKTVADANKVIKSLRDEVANKVRSKTVQRFRMEVENIAQSVVRYCMPTD